MRKNRDEWMDDVHARQRNIVFPDTLENEKRFWQNLGSGRTRLTKLHLVGLLVLLFGSALSLCGMIWQGVHMRLKYEGGNLVGLFAECGLIVLVLAVGFLFLRWRALRALRSIELARRNKTRATDL